MKPSSSSISAALKQIDVTIYIVRTQGDTLGGDVEFVSSGTYRLLGYHPSDFVRDPGLWHRIMHPDDVGAVVQSTQEVFHTRESRTRIYRLRHAQTGEYHWIEDSTVPLIDEQDQLYGIAGVARDITALKRTEHGLLEQKKQIEALVDAMPDGVIVVNTEGRIVQANGGVERILGWASADLTGNAVEMLVPQRFRETHVSLRTDFTASPRIRRMGTFELAALHRDGHEVPVDIMLGAIPGQNHGRVLVLVRDMTEVRESQKKIAHLSSLVQSSEESIIGTDLDGNIVSWNRGASVLFGYDAAEAEGHSLGLIYLPERQDEWRENLENIRAQKQPLRYDARRIRRNGSVFDAAVIVSPVRDRTGQLIGISCICRDISDRLRAESALETAKRAAEVASRTKSEFLANMSHELRTPLNAVIGLTDVVLDTTLEEDQREYLSLVKSSAQSLLTTIGDILDVATIQAGKLLLRPTQFWPREIMQRAIGEIESRAKEKRLALEWKVNDNVPEVLFADSHCIHQILSNLLDNAIKFTHNGGIFVNMDMSPDNAELLRLSVADTGIGIAPPRQQKIFEPFSQVDNSYRREFGGTGLGLAISAQLAGIMGGKIWVDSDGHSGSRFTVALPVEKKESTEAVTFDSKTRPEAAERRQEIRRPENGEVQLRILRPYSARTILGALIDVSSSGLRIRTQEPLNKATLIHAWFLEREVIAEVRYCVPIDDDFYSGLKTISA